MHVLIVEDDPIVADVLGMILEEAGHFKTTANTIETALSELKHNRIDAILLDLNLPDGDGTRLARLVCARITSLCRYWLFPAIAVLMKKSPRLAPAPMVI